MKESVTLPILKPIVLRRMEREIIQNGCNPQKLIDKAIHYYLDDYLKEKKEKRPKVTLHGLTSAEKITISYECYIRVYEYTKEHPSFQLQDVIVYALYVYYKMLLEM